uniref:Uncharacterized protein n=1 Tax=Arundo donax TaxID=35708 RepID=A0A0A8Z6J6_ARUDO
MVPDLLHEETSVEKARDIHLSDKLSKGRSMGDLLSYQRLLSTYIIAEDCLPSEVMKRIKYALRFCIPKKCVYIFHVPVRGKIVYDEELKQICLSGGA